MADEHGDGAWFAPKRFGYGAGLPIAWQGWALMAGYTAAIAGAGFALLPGQLPAFYGVVAVLTVPLVIVAKRRTRGGWRWRSGD